MNSIARLSICFGLMLSLLCSCETDFLEIPVLVGVTEDSFDPAMAVNACYKVNMNVHADPDDGVAWPNIRWRTWQHMVLGDAISDDALKAGQNDGDQTAIREMELFMTNSSNSQVSASWDLLYTRIYYFNWALEGIEENSLIDEPTRQQYMAEVRFLRAYNFFLLTRCFGGVILKTTTDPEKLKKSTQEEVYLFTEKELREVSDILDVWKYEASSQDLGRVTRAAALGLLAKVYLYQGKYEACFEACREIIDERSYSLETDFADLWRRGYPSGNNEWGAESIFEFMVTPTEDVSSSNYYIIAQRPRNKGGWGLCAPTLDLLDEYEKGDPRIISTFLFDHDVFAPGTDMNDTLDAEFNSEGNEHGMLSRKAAIPPTLLPDQAHQVGVNQLVLRYADILLMYAEAANETGRTAEALDKLNAVRRRARNSSRTDPQRVYLAINDSIDCAYYFGPPRKYISYDWDAVDPAEILPDITATDQVTLRHLIWHERRCEFALEGERFYDLMRMDRVEPGLAAETYHAFASKWNLNDQRGAAFRQGTNEIFPIPASEISIMGPENLPQNPNYD